MTRQITTEAELDALPIGTVILSHHYPNGPEPTDTRGSFQKRPDGNWYRGARASWVHPDGFLPATVLYEPGEQNPAQNDVPAGHPGEQPRPLPDREQIAKAIARAHRQAIDRIDAPVYELDYLAADAVLKLLKETQ